MNNATRKRISEIVSVLEGLKEEVSSFASEEQEKHDNLSEGLQQSEKGEAMANAASSLEECEMSFDEILNNLDTAING